jgi:hypothetical protein
VEANEMMLINKDMVEALRERVAHRDKSSQCLEDLKKMLEIKEALFWRADVSSRACASWALVDQLAWETHLIKEAIEAVDEGDRGKAVSLLEEYAAQLEE